MNTNVESDVPRRGGSLLRLSFPANPFAEEFGDIAVWLAARYNFSEKDLLPLLEALAFAVRSFEYGEMEYSVRWGPARVSSRRFSQAVHDLNAAYTRLGDAARRLIQINYPKAVDCLQTVIRVRNYMHELAHPGCGRPTHLGLWRLIWVLREFWVSVLGRSGFSDGFEADFITPEDPSKATYLPTNDPTRFATDVVAALLGSKIAPSSLRHMMRRVDEEAKSGMNPPNIPGCGIAFNLSRYLH